MQQLSVPWASACTLWWKASRIELHGPVIQHKKISRTIVTKDLHARYGELVSCVSSDGYARARDVDLLGGDSQLLSTSITVAVTHMII